MKSNFKIEGEHYKISHKNNLKDGDYIYIPPALINNKRDNWDFYKYAVGIHKIKEKPTKNFEFIVSCEDGINRGFVTNYNIPLKYIFKLINRDNKKRLPKLNFKDEEFYINI
jgi:hypothetical protein